MAIEGTLEGPEGEKLFVGGDSEVVYTDADNPPSDMSTWTVVLDIRKKDTSGDPPLLTKAGILGGVYNSDPTANTQKFTFPLSDDDLSADIFKGDEFEGRYSIKRTNSGFEQPLRYGDAVIVRVTQV